MQTTTINRFGNHPIHLIKPASAWMMGSDFGVFFIFFLHRGEGGVPVPVDSFAGRQWWGEGLQFHCVYFGCLPRKSSRARWLQQRTAWLLRIRCKNWLGSCLRQLFGSICSMSVFSPQRFAVHVELHFSSSFPSADWRNKIKKGLWDWIEQGNLWLQDKLLTSTYQTEPDGFV